MIYAQTLTQFHQDSRQSRLCCITPTLQRSVEGHRPLTDLLRGCMLANFPGDMPSRRKVRETRPTFGTRQRERSREALWQVSLQAFPFLFTHGHLHVFLHFQQPSDDGASLLPPLPAGTHALNRSLIPISLAHMCTTSAKRKDYAPGSIGQRIRGCIAFE